MRRWSPTNLRLPGRNVSTPRFPVRLTILRSDAPTIATNRVQLDSVGESGVFAPIPRGGPITLGSGRLNLQTFRSLTRKLNRREDACLPTSDSFYSSLRRVLASTAEAIPRLNPITPVGRADDN